MAEESSISEEAKQKLAASLGGTTSGNSSQDSAKAEDKRAGSGALRDRTSKEEVLSSLIRTIEDATGIEKDEISPRSHLDNDLNIDSLSKIDIAVQLEDQYGIRLDEEDVQNAGSVQGLADLVRERAGHETT